MLGDQLALAWVVRSNPNFDARTFSRREAFLYKIGGASVLFLPCSLYNWTPPEGAGQFHGMPLDVKVNKHIYLVTGRFCYISSNIFLLNVFSNRHLSQFWACFLDPGSSFQGIKKATYARVLELLIFF